ncbi:MAG TPA: hypothetical protein VHK69_09785 [Chitinophagaceae bacterium]|nr:hypothetical protein [Chitinophagaceae bacterium]
MKGTVAFAGGLAGAGALTLIHETVKRIEPKAPRMDLLGMTALSKAMLATGKVPPPPRKLFMLTMAGDLAANALFYSIAGIGHKQGVVKRGIILGLSAGLGAVLLPGRMGLPEAPSNRTSATRLMTLGLYLAGGIVAALISKTLEQRREQRVMLEDDQRPE